MGAPPHRRGLDGGEVGRKDDGMTIVRWISRTSVSRLGMAPGEIPILGFMTSVEEGVGGGKSRKGNGTSG